MIEGGVTRICADPFRTVKFDEVKYPLAGLDPDLPIMSCPLKTPSKSEMDETSPY